MTDDEVLELLRGETPWNKARREFTHYRIRIDEEIRSQHGLTALDLRRGEFEAVKAIAFAMLGEKPLTNAARLKRGEDPGLQ